MRLEPLEGLPLLRTVPQPVVSTAGPRVTVDVDDDEGRRVHLTFSPFQAVRVTTADVFQLPEDVDMVARQLAVVADSPWLVELANTLKQQDPGATFMDRSRHFFLQAGDHFIEVAAWSVAWESAAGTGRYPAEDLPAW